MALPPGAMGLSAVCDCGNFLIILTYYFQYIEMKQNIQIGRLNDQLLRCFSPVRFSHSYLYIWDHPLYIFKGAQVGIPNEQ